MGRDVSDTISAKERCLYRFNPRARMGRDKSLNLLPTLFHSFNPRARMGRDYFPNVWLGKLGCFNPRARMGRDRL